MTIEEKFFKTFGIEPKERYIFSKDCSAKISQGITDRVLLELICILSGRCNCTLEIKEKNIENLKIGLLQLAIDRAHYVLDKDKYRHQVQALFEGE